MTNGRGGEEGSLTKIDLRGKVLRRIMRYVMKRVEGIYLDGSKAEKSWRMRTWSCVIF